MTIDQEPFPQFEASDFDRIVKRLTELGCHVIDINPYGGPVFEYRGQYFSIQPSMDSVEPGTVTETSS